MSGRIVRDHKGVVHEQRGTFVTSRDMGMTACGRSFVVDENHESINFGAWMKTWDLCVTRVDALVGCLECLAMGS